MNRATCYIFLLHYAAYFCATDPGRPGTVRSNHLAVKSSWRNMDLATLMNDQAPDCIYLVDAELIKAYVSKTMPKWNEYVDYVSKKRRRFFVTAMVRSLLNFRLPPPFLPSEDPDYESNIDFNVEISLPLLFKVFKI